MSPRARLSRWLSSVVLAVVMVVQSASAQDAVAPTAPSANDLHEFTRLLGDTRIQEWIRDQADTAENLAAENHLTARQQLDEVVARTGKRVEDLSKAWASIGHAPQVIAAQWQEQMTKNKRVRSLTFVLIFLFLGAGLEWLVRQYTNPLHKRIEASKFDTPQKRTKAAMTRAALTLSGLAAFAVGSIGAFSTAEWPPLLYALILNMLATILAVRVVGTLLVLFLAPFVPQLRLVPISTPMARTIGRTIMLLFAVLFFSIAAIDVFDQLNPPAIAGTQAPETLAVAIAFAGLMLVLVLGAITFTFMRARQRGITVSRKTLGKWRAYLSFLSLLTFGLWLLDMRPLMATVVWLGALIPTLQLLRAWVNATFERAITDFHVKNPPPAPVILPESEEPVEVLDDIESEPAPIIDPYETYRPIAQRLIRFAAIICVGFMLALIWNIGIFENTGTPTVMQRLFSVLIDSAAAVLIADLVWTWGKSAIDRRLSAYKPPEDGSAPGPEARMATLLPLLRVVLMVTLLAMVIMSVLSSMGVNIAPILAGASVMGIAIGFGAQSLVKDVVSGIFFLVDDAFRVGEYVEIDQLRGTVERISIRSLQIRHHRGAVHTLPFGELKSMTNYSRDWVIMKLEFRVPFDTDLQLVKKLIKKVGAELKANPDYGDGIIETLKSQGVRRMEEFNMVVGVKFMTRPGEQWLVRRDAYQKVRDVFDANGIRMAERNVKVEIAGDEKLTADERTAAMAAAQEATMNPLPPGPIPDEP